MAGAFWVRLLVVSPFVAVSSASTAVCTCCTSGCSALDADAVAAPSCGLHIGKRAGQGRHAVLPNVDVLERVERALQRRGVRTTGRRCRRCRAGRRRLAVVDDESLPQPTSTQSNAAMPRTVQNLRPERISSMRSHFLRGPFGRMSGVVSTDVGRTAVIGVGLGRAWVRVDVVMGTSTRTGDGSAGVAGSGHVSLHGLGVCLELLAVDLLRALEGLGDTVGDGRRRDRDDRTLAARRGSRPGP